MTVLFAITTEDVDATIEGRDITDDQRELLYEHVSRMPSDTCFDQIDDLYLWIRSK